MKKSADLNKDERVKREISRLRKIFKGLSKEAKAAVEGLIIEAADLRIRLEDIREDLDKNGYDELFSQSEHQEPYERERPQARRYVALNKSYQSIIKQLSEHIPKKNNLNTSDEKDALMEFIKND